MFGDRGGIHCQPVSGRAHQIESVCCLYNRIVVLERVQLRKSVECGAERYSCVIACRVVLEAKAEVVHRRVASSAGTLLTH